MLAIQILVVAKIQLPKILTASLNIFDGIPIKLTGMIYHLYYIVVIYKTTKCSILPQDNSHPGVDVISFPTNICFFNVV